MAYSRLDIDMQIAKYYDDAKNGRYNNPQDIDERLTKMLNGCCLTADEKNEYEDEIQYCIDLFWDW